MVLGRYLLSSLVLSLLGAGLASPTPEDVAELYAPPPARRPQAIYVASNEVAGNAVVAFKINNDGTLSDGSVTATGGKGGNGFDLLTNSSAGPDALASQGSVSVAGRHLLVVNAGSNTVTLFEIDAGDATKLVMVGKPTYTLGDFPVSVAVSERLQQACVANSGVKAGIACFQITSGGLVALESQLSRVFDLQQTTPPSIFQTDISHTVFNDDSTALITTVRGPLSLAHPGLISVYPVLANGRVSTHDVRTSPPRTSLVFGIAPIPGTRDPRTGSSAFVIADASFGAALIRISATTGAVATVAATAIPNQNGTCWAAYSAATRSVFVADAGGNTLVEIDPATGAILRDLATTVGNVGSIDLVAPANGFVYALSFAADPRLTPAVAVYDVTAGRATARLVQNYRPSAAFRLSNNTQGMAVY